MLRSVRLMSTRPNHSRRQLSWRTQPVPPGHAAQTAIGNRSMQGPLRVETEDWLLPLRLSEYQRLILDLLEGQEF
jgi:hypothetical protein